MPATAIAEEAPKLERPEGLIHRSFSGEIKRIRADVQKNETDLSAVRYEFTASSDAEVEMWGGMFEILDHSPKAVRLDWLNSGNAPALWMHERGEQVGRIESAKLEGGKIKVVVRVAPSQEDLIADLDGDIIRNVSIGYRVFDEKVDSRELDDEGFPIRTVWRVTDWEPSEVSFVTIPADRSVGIGRNEDGSPGEMERRVKFLEDRLRAETTTTMPQAPTTPDAARAENTPAATPSISVSESKRHADDAVSQERGRIAAIHAAARKAEESGLGNHRAAAETFVSEGRSVAAFQAHVLDNVPQNPGVSQRELGVSDKEAARYDLTKVMDGLVRGDLSKCGHELEVSDALKQRSGKSNDRVAIPLDVLMRGYIPKDDRGRTLISVGLSGSGQSNTASNLVDTDLLASMFIESLRESTPVLGLGVTMISGLTGDVSIPKELVNPDFYWVAEDAEPTEGGYSLGTIDLVFKTLAGRIPFTRQALKQSTPNLENLLTNSLRRGLGIAIEKALINGAGSSTVPEGVLQASGIGSVTTSGTVTHDHLLQLEELLGTANAAVGEARTLTSSRGKRRLFGAKKDTGSGLFLAERDGAGFMTDIGPGVVSNNVPTNLTDGGDPATLDRTAIIHGVWRSLIVGMWGGMELARDTATKAPTGGVVLRVFQDLDSAVSRAGEFAAIQDLS